MFCINCGKQLEEGSRFCPYCGAKVPDLTSSAPANPPYPNGQSGAPEGNPAVNSDISNPFQPQNPPAGDQSQPGTDAWGQPDNNDAGQSGSGFQSQPGPNYWGQSGGNDAGQPGGGFQGQAGTGYWGQPDGAGQTGTGFQGQANAGNQNQNKGGFDPWAMKGGPTQTGAGPRDDPWGVRGGVNTAAAVKPKKKKHTVRNVILIVLGVIVLALVGLYILGSTIQGKYEPLIKSYLSYAEDSNVQQVESLFYPEIVDNYHLIFGSTETIYYLDSWTDNYGQTVDRYEISEIDEEDDELDYFNQRFGLQATEYVDVTVNVFYDNGRYSCMDFDMVQVDGSWYLAYIW